MSLTNAKKELHHKNSLLISNGGIAVKSPKGSNPEQSVSKNFTKNPLEIKGVNKDIKISY